MINLWEQFEPAMFPIGGSLCCQAMLLAASAANVLRVDVLRVDAVRLLAVHFRTDCLVSGEKHWGQELLFFSQIYAKVFTEIVPRYLTPPQMYLCDSSCLIGLRSESCAAQN
jgi:hypothetical protein